jgi:hypothetical protein
MNAKVAKEMSREILALIDDLFLVPRIEDVARNAGFNLRVIAQPDDFGIRDAPATRRVPLTEPLEGGDALLVREVSALQPCLILVDANAKRLPWARWIQVLKTSAATRRIPILVFGPHVQKELLEKARSQGADVVLSRGAFTKRLAELINEHSLPDRTQELSTACEGELALKARQGIELHNRAEFFEAHELFEEAWMEADMLESYLYRAMLQFTVAYLHLSRDNLAGAQKMLLRIHQWLDPLPDTCREVDVAKFKRDVATLRAGIFSKPPSTDLHPKRIQLVS